jgi:MFS family permease
VVSADSHAPNERYGWYLVVVLMVCYTLSFVDRQILSLLVGPIKEDLKISDTAMGLLQGLAFALFYTMMGIPFGRLADTGNRRNIIALGLAVWSVMTALCAIARSFATLFLARIGVGVGEAALGPSAYSMLADSFPKERVSKPMSVYAMGIFIGSGLAMIVGGAVVQATSHMSAMTLPILGSFAPWRMTFLIVGIPGLLVALWLLSVREPQRHNLARDGAGAARSLTFGESVAFVRRRWQSFLGLSLGMVFQSMVTFAFTAWGPEYFKRVHGWNAGQTGLTLGLVILTAGCLGMFVGGTLADHWRRQGQTDAGLKVLLLSAFGTGVCFVGAFLCNDPFWAVVLIAPAIFFEGMPIGSAFASIQLIFPNQARGVATAMFIFIFNIGGQTLGPLFPALLNDYYFHSGQQIGTSLAITMAGAAIAMLVIFSVVRPVYRRHYAQQMGELADATLPQAATPAPASAG